MLVDVVGEDTVGEDTVGDDTVGEDVTPFVLPQPPYGAAPGPLVDDDAVLAAYANNGGEVGHSSLLHVEGASLLADGDVAVGLWIAENVVLVRVDLPEDLLHVGAALAHALEAAGLQRLDEQSLLAGPVALQVLGFRLSTWDLWGADLEIAFEALRRAAVGEQAIRLW